MNCESLLLFGVTEINTKSPFEIPVSFNASNDWKLRKYLKRAAKSVGAKCLLHTFVSPLVNSTKEQKCCNDSRPGCATTDVG
jgi:hypothetical protein